MSSRHGECSSREDYSNADLIVIAIAVFIAVPIRTERCETFLWERSSEARKPAFTVCKIYVTSLRRVGVAQPEACRRNGDAPPRAGLPLRMACSCPKISRWFGLSYQPRDIEAGLRAVGLKAGDTVDAISSLSRLPGLDGYAATGDTSAVFCDVLRSVIGDDGTIVVPTSSQNLCNTEIIFDPATTPSFERGLLPEYIRRLPGARAEVPPFHVICRDRCQGRIHY